MKKKACIFIEKIEKKEIIYAIIPENKKEEDKFWRKEIKLEDVFNRNLLVKGIPEEDVDKLKDYDFISGEIGIEQETGLVCFIYNKRCKKRSLLDKKIEDLLPVGFSVNNITPISYNELWKLAQEEKRVSSIISNGFAIDRKFVVYGKKAKEGILSEPFYIKLK